MPVRVRRRSITTALSKFEPTLVRPCVLREAERHERIGDLAVSFPAALFLLATGERGTDATNTARALVVAGAPLRAISEALSLPMWTRKLPPGAFNAKLGQLPDSPEFALRIANHLPHTTVRAHRWFAWVREACLACDEHLAVWAAREFNRLKRHGDPRGFRVLGAYAWYSQRPDLEASQWTDKPWSPAMSFAEAGYQADRWLERLSFAFCPMPPFRPVHFKQVTIDGLVFERLETASQFLETSKALDNCISSYAGWLDDRDQIWRVRDANKIVAALALRYAKSSWGMPGLAEASGYRNEELEPRLRRAIYRMLLDWPELNGEPLPTGEKIKRDMAAYRRVFKPYWLAKGGRDVFASNCKDTDSPLKKANLLLSDLRYPVNILRRRLQERQRRLRN